MTITYVMDTEEDYDAEVWSSLNPGRHEDQSVTLKESA